MISVFCRLLSNVRPMALFNRSMVHFTSLKDVNSMYNNSLLSLDMRSRHHARRFLRSSASSSLSAINTVDGDPSHPSRLEEILQNSRLTRIAHELWLQIVRPGDTVVDATCGNGHDTVFLATVRKIKITQLCTVLVLGFRV